MAWPWLAVAVKTIPWTTLVRRAPDIIDAAASLLGSKKAGQEAHHAAAKTESQLSAFQQRLKFGVKGFYVPEPGYQNRFGAWM